MKLENVKEKRVFITLDREREIRFNLGAAATYEETFKEDFFSAIDRLQQGKSLPFVRNLLYVGLKAEDKTLTIEQVEKLVPLRKFIEVKNKIIEALNVSLTAPEDAIETNMVGSLGPAGKKS
jgi:hypothetical protein